MPENSLKTRISALPQTPGIYIYKDAKGDILYVGKAKNLRSRVRSYFGKSADLGPAKERMVSLIADLETIATDTELEALVLEANLIRKHQPPYNVLLRDDKYYLFIKITKDVPPRIFPVRKIIKDNSKYFGPYSSAQSVRGTLRLLRRIFPFREEKDRPRDVIFPHALFRQSFSPSYEGELEGVVRDASQLNDPTSPPLIRGEENAQNVARFLNGNRQEIITTLEDGIKYASDNLQYEQAGLFRDQLQAIMRLEGSQKVYLTNKESFDVISISQAKNQSAGNVLQIREGKLIGKQTFLLRHRSSTLLEDILRQFIMQYYGVAQDIPKKIYIPIKLEDHDLISDLLERQAEQRETALSLSLSQNWERGTSGQISFLVPVRGNKKQLLNMGELNAKNLLREEEVETQTKKASREAMEELLRAINIQPLELPHSAKASRGAARGDSFRIETYDISNTQGNLATASMVVFIDGSPAKDQYRKFKIKLNADLAPEHHKSNDFAMLEETLTRRLAKMEWPLPNLIIIDGGRGQLSSSQKALKKTGLKIPIISIAKREEIIFAPNSPLPPTSLKLRGAQQLGVLSRPKPWRRLEGRPQSITANLPPSAPSPQLGGRENRIQEIHLPYDSPALYLIQRMRDEAHRFTITYHKKLRSKNQIKSVLDDISGIGPKTKKILLQTFGSVTGIKNALDLELENAVGKKKAKILREWL